MSQLVDEAADALERRVFFDQLSARYEVLRAEPAAWREIEAERTLEGGALSSHVEIDQEGSGLDEVSHGFDPGPFRA
jgi:hypothetical protein